MCHCYILGFCDNLQVAPEPVKRKGKAEKKAAPPAKKAKKPVQPEPESEEEESEEESEEEEVKNTFMVDRTKSYWMLFLFYSRLMIAIPR